MQRIKAKGIEVKEFNVIAVAPQDKYVSQLVVLG
jgi:hypothetical protein